MKLGITGYPLTYTQSPKLHRSFLAKARKKGSYDVLPFEPKKGKAAFHRFLDQLSAAGYRGINVTVPFKEWAYDYARTFAPCIHGECAKKVKAANTLIFTKRGVLAANTDAFGLWDDIASWKELASKELEVWIVGTGGSARGALAGLLQEHPFSKKISRTRVWGRSKAKARALEKLLLRKSKSRAVKADAALVVWCLPPVEKDEAKSLWEEISQQASSKKIYLYDLNYAERARATERLLPARRRKSGLGMLKRQARIAFDLWVSHSW